jgi:hypothetical protein
MGQSLTTVCNTVSASLSTCAVNRQAPARSGRTYARVALQTEEKPPR